MAGECRSCVSEASLKLKVVLPFYQGLIDLTVPSVSLFLAAA